MPHPSFRLPDGGHGLLACKVRDRTGTHPFLGKLPPEVNPVNDAGCGSFP